MRIIRKISILLAAALLLPAILVPQGGKGCSRTGEGCVSRDGGRCRFTRPESGHERTGAADRRHQRESADSYVH
ncbi:hypothetical protein ACFSQ7_15425 [Paenibacillus rhizoplanae]